MIRLAYGRLYDCFSRWLSISYAVDIQHRHDGRWDFPELPDSERDSKPALLTDDYYHAWKPLILKKKSYTIENLITIRLMLC